MGREIISKELLSDVLDLDENLFLDSISLQSNTLQCLIKSSKNSNWDLKEINVHELAHKCKKWAIMNKYVISSETNTYASYSYIGLDVLRGGFKEEFEADTEPEAVFKACQWILENKDRK